MRADGVSPCLAASLSGYNGAGLTPEYHICSGRARNPQGGPQVEIIGLIIFGAIIGALGRLVVPGKQPVPIWLTIVLGVLGALAGYYIAGALGVGQTAGIDWIRWIISIA